MARMHEDTSESAVVPRDIRARRWSYVLELGLWGFLLVVSALIALIGWPGGGIAEPPLVLAPQAGRGDGHRVVLCSWTKRGPASP